jgi:hypothetical protein
LLLRYLKNIYIAKKLINEESPPIIKDVILPNINEVIIIFIITSINAYLNFTLYIEYKVITLASPILIPGIYGNMQDMIILSIILTIEDKDASIDKVVIILILFFLFIASNPLFLGLIFPSNRYIIITR